MGEMYHWSENGFIVCSQPILLCLRTRPAYDKVVEVQRDIGLFLRTIETRYDQYTNIRRAHNAIDV